MIVESTTHSFRDAMRANGLNTSDHIIADGKLHRFHVEGDPRNKRNGFYTLHLDEHPAGMFGCWKRGGGEAIKWSAKSSTRLSLQERRALQAKAMADKARRAAEDRAKFDAGAVKANAIWDAAEPCEDHPYLDRKGVKSYGFRCAEWVIDRGHDPDTGEIRELRIPGSLLIKIRNERNEIVSLQAIFPKKNETLGRDRDFLAGGEKKGCWYSFGAPVIIADKKTVVICEGAATAASVFEATGIGAVVAFDAGNLKPVAETIRRLWPDMEIIIAADNDQFTKGNPGVAFGTAAATAVGGYVAVPQFADLDGMPTDMNDLHCREGIAAVRDQVMACLAVEPPARPAPEPEPEAAAPSAEETEAEKKATLKAQREAKRQEKLAKAAARAAEYAANPDMYDPSRYFTVLGHDRTNIFLYSHEMKLVVSHSITSLNKHAMLKFARPDFWKLFSANPEGDDRPNWDACANWLIDESYKRGYYDPSKTRGRGAWLDDGRIVYHFGNMLMVDGVETAVTAIKSKCVYEQGKMLPPPSDEALTDVEGRHIFDIAKMFRWTRPGSAVLLAGYVALAPICGALKWRPHIWLTGAAGSGKTTALNDFVSVLTSGTALFSQGNSTEAGIRQKLQSDALPVLFDESEQGKRRPNSGFRTSSHSPGKPAPNPVPKPTRAPPMGKASIILSGRCFASPRLASPSKATPIVIVLPSWRCVHAAGMVVTINGLCSRTNSTTLAVTKTCRPG
jgi:putative DNA primase/helicase